LLSSSQLSREITEFTKRRTEALITRFLPDFHIPAFFCGIKRSTASEEPDLSYTLGNLYKLGVVEVAGVSTSKAMATLLRRVDGPATETFYSYRVAESLLAFGPFAGNPLLAGFTAAECENIRAATDSTKIYDPEKQSLGGFPNNYWAVLARCEFARQRLGILKDDSLLRRCIGHLENLLFKNSTAFFDDDNEGGGRYDIYSADVHLFSEPMWHLLDAKKLDFNLRQHVLLLEKIAMENGASCVYGRSIGALSICMTMELSAMALARGLATDPARSLGLIRHAFDAFQGWFEDDLINAHRGANTEGYRGIYRLMQMTVDCLGKLCYVAQKLRELPEASSEPANGVLFPAIDDYTAFDSRNAGLWMFRNAHISFQLPVTDGWNADYNASPRSPGVFENPVGGGLFCCAPRIAIGPHEYTPSGLPDLLLKSPASLSLSYETIRCVGGPKPHDALSGRYAVTWRVEGETIHCEGTVSLDREADGISFFIPESECALNVITESAQSLHQDTVAVSGMSEWRSAWGETKLVHQIHFKPAREIAFSIAITPKLRVRSIPMDDHDYTRALFAAMPEGWIAERPRPAGIGLDAKILSRNIDIFHVGWPEHCFWPSGETNEEFDARTLRFIEEMSNFGVRIVWTMHNRRPHAWEAERGKRLYRAWAPVVDGVIHHSAWGMNLMRSELPYNPHARHVVIPHGHFGEQMQISRSRSEIEASLGLPPCAMRFGITGRWQKEKQVELIMEAFQSAARPNQQLVLTAYKQDMVKPDDPRIIFLPRKDWMLREEIAEHIRLCDALVSAHTGDTYLTSGLSADAVGAGLAMFVPHWEFFHETLGDAPVYHDNTLESLTAAFAVITPADIERGKAAFRALQAGCAWPLIAEKTLAFYRSLGKKPHRY
jgi:glycosyltransferase involved in cell wall biosynthesis